MNFFQKNFAIQNYICAKFWTFEDDKKRQYREYCDQAVSTIKYLFFSEHIKGAQNSMKHEIKI